AGSDAAAKQLRRAPGRGAAAIHAETAAPSMRRSRLYPDDVGRPSSSRRSFADGCSTTGENAQRKAIGDIAATDFPNARTAHALLSCRFSRQSLEVGDHVKLLRRVTERYVRHECARDRVRWICDPGAQIVVRPGQSGLLQGIRIRKSRYGCGGSPDNPPEACAARAHAPFLCGGTS